MAERTEGNTPGPFSRDGRHICKDGETILSWHFDARDGDEAERDEMVDLLNKGAHFDEAARQRDMLLKAAKAIGCICIGTVMPKRAVDHSESCRNLTAAIDECEAK